MAVWEHSVEGIVDAPPESVWALWEDAERWPEWNVGIAGAQLDGPLVLGACAFVRFKRSLGTTTFRVTDVEPPHRFVDEGRLPGATLAHRHVAEPAAGGGTHVRHELALVGPAAGVWSRLLGRRIRSAAAEFVAREAALARVPAQSAFSPKNDANGLLL